MRLELGPTVFLRSGGTGKKEEVATAETSKNAWSSARAGNHAVDEKVATGYSLAHVDVQRDNATYGLLPRRQRMKSMGKKFSKISKSTKLLRCLPVGIRFVKVQFSATVVQVASVAASRES